MDAPDSSPVSIRLGLAEVYVEEDIATSLFEPRTSWSLWTLCELAFSDQRKMNVQGKV